MEPQQLDWKTVRKIRKLYDPKAGYSYSVLAGMFGVSKYTIKDIIKEKTWKPEKEAYFKYIHKRRDNVHDRTKS